MRRLSIFLIPIFIILGLSLAIRAMAKSQPVGEGNYPGSDFQTQTTTLTISGTVSGPGGGVAGIEVQINSAQTGLTKYTNASGFYSATLDANGPILFKVRPPLATRLSQLNYSAEGKNTDFTQDFTVTNGNLLSVLPIDSGSNPVTGPAFLTLLALQSDLSQFWWYELEWDSLTQRYQAMLPPDIYYVRILYVPQGYYPTFVPFDLRTIDHIVDIPINTHPVSPIPEDAPVASKITISAIDELGEAVVVGAPGAAMPYGRILVVNLNSQNQAYTISEADGSFHTKVFAPPGSSIMVKHGPADELWFGLKNGLLKGRSSILPGTIIYIKPDISAEAGDLPFSSVGAAQCKIDLDTETRDYVGAAWVIQGVLHPVGENSYQATTTIRIYSPAITPTTDLNGIDVTGSLDLFLQHNVSGQPLARKNRFMSTVISPTGFPIEIMKLSDESLGVPVTVSNWRNAGDHTIEGDINLSFSLTGLQPGIYRPYIIFPIFEIGLSSIPTDSTWVGSGAGGYTYPYFEALLPPIRYGDVAQPRLVWRLLEDIITQGQQGTGAFQDAGSFGLVSEIVSQGAPYTVPPVEERTGDPIIYRLTPHLPMISYADRFHPSPPLITFDLPGGELHIEVRKPDGQVVDLGVAPLSQSTNRTPSNPAGKDLNLGTQKMDDAYALISASDQFDYIFDQYGLHVITMTGYIEDIWGNTYLGGGTYEVWAAHTLDIDPGVLPGTPLAVGDFFNPAITIYPRIPAEVNLDVTLYPDSDPGQAIHQAVGGLSNAYGFFGQGEPLIEMTHPGEYRVDLFASGLDHTGRLYVGAMTWGGVVMTPPAEAELAAHGRRGMDVPEFPDTAWFVTLRDVTVPLGLVAHIHPPYFQGDLIWSRFIDVNYGDSLLLNPSLQDLTGGVWSSLLRHRAETMSLDAMPPNDLETRFDRGEIPVFFSTASGKPPQIAADDLNQISYAYEYSERPGIRVREYLAEDNFLAYWRLDTTYDGQLGVGIQGDIEKDFKFQYLGIVFRDLESDHNEYLGYGSGWVFIPDDDPLGSRVMPPFAGQGNGGWTTEGGPIMTLKGQDIDIFILPTGVQPGSVLTAGDTFRFAGHIMPTLPSQVTITVTAPSGFQHTITGQANPVGYFYEPSTNFIVVETGVWTVDVKVWHDGMCSGGHTIPPFPQGDVLGSEIGRYYFYVVPVVAQKLVITSPEPGFLHFGTQMTPIHITGQTPPGMTDISLDATIHMPGYILQHGQATISGPTFELIFDPETLAGDFPNLDLTAREDLVPGLSDTISINIMLTGHIGEQTVNFANVVVFQGNQVFIDSPPPYLPGQWIYLPSVRK